MRRRSPDERLDRLRLDLLDQELAALRRRAVRWVADNRAALRSLEVDTPKDLSDRAADNWRPLITIATAAGGDWPERAHKAALVLSVQGAETDDSLDVIGNAKLPSWRK